MLTITYKLTENDLASINKIVDDICFKEDAQPSEALAFLAGVLLEKSKNQAKCSIKCQVPHNDVYHSPEMIEAGFKNGQRQFMPGLPPIKPGQFDDLIGAMVPYKDV